MLDKKPKKYGTLNLPQTGLKTLSSCYTSLQKYLRCFRRDTRAVTGVIFALVLPVILTAALAAADYSYILSMKIKLQAASDAAVLAAAKDMLMTFLCAQADAQCRRTGYHDCNQRVEEHDRDKEYEQQARGIRHDWSRIA